MVSNDTSVLSGNGGTSMQSAPKKRASKKSASAKSPGQSPAKSSSTRISAPIEILFTQEPNPNRPAVEPFIWIDFPQQGDVLKAPTYVIRLGVGGADLVEISINKSPWLPCRLTSGYWWYDWSNFSRGKHTMVARMRTPDGRWFKTPLRQCDYRPE